jgi:hypothetical protein
MNTYPKVVLCGVALAAFVAAPAVAKSRIQHHNIHAQVYSNNTVVQDGYVLGADPDRGVRLELRRDGRYWQDNWVVGFTALHERAPARAGAPFVMVLPQSIQFAFVAGGGTNSSLIVRAGDLLDEIDRRSALSITLRAGDLTHRGRYTPPACYF